MKFDNPPLLLNLVESDIEVALVELGILEKRKASASRHAVPSAYSSLWHRGTTLIGSVELATEV